MTDNTSTTGQVGAGQQIPNDSNALPNQIAFAFRSLMAQLDLMKPVKVVAVHPGAGTPPKATTVDVLPLVQQIDGNGNAVPHGTVHGIPVDRLQGGGWTVILDPAVGDVGYVVAGDRDMSKVKATKDQAPPGSRRSWNISDGVYRGGILMDPTSAYLWLKADGSLKLADKGGFVLETDGSGNGKVTGNLLVSGNLQLSGSIEALDGTTYAGNIHTTGSLSADGEVTAHASGSIVTLTQHIHSANNTPPTPGH
jgi:hypothetical protein